MKRRRLRILLIVMLALLALRWWVPPSNVAASEAPVAAVPLSARPAVHEAVAAVVAAAPASSADPLATDLSAGTRDLDLAEPRNAFAVRLPPSPPQPVVPAPVQVAVRKPFVGPPAPPPVMPPPPPPFEVIGSWRDEQGVSLFVAGPQGVQQVRVGDVLAEYRFAEITPTQVSLKHLPSNRDVPLSVPPGAATTLLSAK